MHGRAQRPIIPLTGVLLLLLAGPLSAQFPADSTRTVDVLGTPTRVLTIGLEQRAPGAPVIVLETGGLEPLETWGSWPLMLSELAPVVGYERAGLGETPWDGASPTPEHVTGRLRALLATIDVPPPYVLVGHSWGTELVGWFAAEHPDEVAGVVHLDPTPDFTPELFYGTADPDSIAARQAALDATAEELPAGQAAEMELLGPPARPLLPPSDLPTAVVLAYWVPDEVPAVAWPWQTLDWVRAFQRHKLSFFVDAARHLTRATVIIATDVTHFVFRDDPRLTLEAVRWVLDATGGGS